MGVVPIASKRRPKAPSGEPAPATGLYTAPDGSELYFEDTGGPHPVMFYIYGLGCSIYHWKYPRSYFDPKAATEAGRRPHRQVWMDFRGHGKSPPPLGGTRLTMDAIIADLKGLCAFRGIEQATFLGQSMGGSIAMALAHEAPELAKGLVLLASPGRDPGAWLPLQPVSGLLWKGMIELNKRVPLAFKLGHALAAPYRHHPLVVYPLIEICRHGGFNAELTSTADIDEYVRKLLDVNPSLFYDMAAALSSFDVAKLDPPVTCPALVIAGGSDQVVPVAEARRVASCLPRAELEVVPHGSHCPHFDDPGLVNRRIEEFLDANGL